MENELQEHHVMILECTHPSGAEEWYCPTCARRILMQWPPNYRKIILEEGDESAIHSGGKGGVSMGGVQINKDPQEDSLPIETPESQEDDLLSTADQERLDPFQQWIDKVNFDNLWQDG